MQLWQGKHAASATDVGTLPTDVAKLACLLGSAVAKRTARSFGKLTQLLGELAVFEKTGKNWLGLWESWFGFLERTGRKNWSGFKLISQFGTMCRSHGGAKEEVNLV